eukprot:TRINITY_DN93258_c0_g1_i1.p1 TRINITY_DN93258_c0_g1~~TRINITY_DN93258_c0_g1_i1.p1  ORF type:complete len:283 (+),score=23.89 TRINITY_DN93258_c0_g1_i1:306-1154(+)
MYALSSTTLVRTSRNICVAVCWASLVTAANCCLKEALAMDAPTLPFVMMSAFISLQMVFRTQTSYQRLKDGRESFEAIATLTRALARMATLHLPPEAGQQVANLSASFCWCSMAQLRGLDDRCEVQGFLRVQLKGLAFSEQEVQRFLARRSQSPTSVILFDLTEVLAKATGPAWALGKLQKTVDDLAMMYGKCEQLRRTPMPLSFGKHGHRCLVAYLMGLPFALWPTGHRFTPLYCGMIAMMAFGIDETGIQIEEPFAILPLTSVCQAVETEVLGLHELQEP